jgi:hypothetical protein
MRNHKFVEQVAQAMITYNNTFYIEDINELIVNNIYGNDISTYLTNIINILNGMINNNNNIYQTNINNLNNNTTIIKNALKMYIIRILNLNNGYDILRQLICEDM